jgi:MFS transporter, PPP family, 3-phenylpropionic acid transporter
LGAITPAVTFLVSPLWGALADTTGTLLLRDDCACSSLDTELAFTLSLSLSLSLSIYLSLSLACVCMIVGRHKEIMLFTFLGSILTRSLLAFSNANIVLLGSIVALSAALNAPVKPLLDSAVMASLSDKSLYGKCRLYGQIGFGLGSFVVGPLWSQSSPSSLFLTQALLAIPTALLMRKFEFQRNISTSPKAPSSSIIKKNWFQRTFCKSSKREIVETVDLVTSLRQTLLTPTVMVFFFMVFIIGISSGIIENFAYVRIAEVLGESTENKNILGICRLASSFTGGPMFWLSSHVVQFLGVNGVLTMSLIAYVLRFVIYSVMENPWQALPAEMLRGFTFATFWAGATYYVYGIAPKGLSATMVSNSRFQGFQ